MKFTKDNKAQSGAVFRLMIDGIIGFVILLMILSTLAYFDAISYHSDRTEFLSKVQTAVQSPNEKIVSSKGPLRFAEGAGFTSIDLRNLTGHGASCFTFRSNLAFVEVEDNSITFNQNSSTIVYIQCGPSRTSICDFDSLDDDCCEIECIVSFGEKI